MRIKFIFILFLIFSLSLTIYPKVSIKIGPSVSMFNSKDDSLKQVYGRNNFVYGFKAGSTIWNGFSGWIIGNFYKAESRVSYTKESIKFDSNTFGIKIRYTPQIKWMVRPYLSLGYINTSYNEKGEDETVVNVKGSGGGFSASLGFDFCINQRFYFEIETKYDSVKVNPTGFNVELGGISIVASFLIRVL